MEEEKESKSTPESKRLKESEWLVIISLWERGEVTLRELSERFSVSESALSQGFKRRGIKRGSKAHITFKEIESKTKEEREKLIEEIYNFKKKFVRYGDFLMNLTMNQITEAKKTPSGKLASIRSEIDTIIAATKVYKTIRNDMFHLYDLYNQKQDDNEDYNFNIGVYTQEDIEREREKQRIFDEFAAEQNDPDLDSADEDGEE